MQDFFTQSLSFTSAPPLGSKKKIAALEVALKLARENSPSAPRIIVVEGPCGCGKKTCISYLACRLKFFVKLIYPDGEALSEQSSVGIQNRGQSLINNLHSALFFNSLQNVQSSCDKRPLVVLDGYSSLYENDSFLKKFREFLAIIVRCKSMAFGPLVIVLTTGTKEKKFLNAVYKGNLDLSVNETRIRRIEFNPISNTEMTLFLNAVMRNLYKMFDKKRKFNTDTRDAQTSTYIIRKSDLIIPLIVQTSKGDIRFAINELRLCYSQMMKSKETEMNMQNKLQECIACSRTPELDHTNTKDGFIDSFHLLGKLLYNKRIPVETSSPKPFLFNEASILPVWATYTACPKRKIKVPFSWLHLQSCTSPTSSDDDIILSAHEIKRTKERLVDSPEVKKYHYESSQFSVSPHGCYFADIWHLGDMIIINKNTSTPLLSLKDLLAVTSPMISYFAETNYFTKSANLHHIKYRFEQMKPMEHKVPNTQKKLEDKHPVRCVAETGRTIIDLVDDEEDTLESRAAPTCMKPRRRLNSPVGFQNCSIKNTGTSKDVENHRASCTTTVKGPKTKKLEKKTNNWFDSIPIQLGREAMSPKLIRPPFYYDLNILFDHNPELPHRNWFTDMIFCNYVNYFGEIEDCAAFLHTSTMVDSTFGCGRSKFQVSHFDSKSPINVVATPNISQMRVRTFLGREIDSDGSLENWYCIHIFGRALLDCNLSPIKPNANIRETVEVKGKNSYLKLNTSMRRKTFIPVIQFKHYC